MNKVILRLVVFGCITLFSITAVYLWWSDAVSAVDPQNRTRQLFVVEKGENIRNIATRLKNAGLIKDQIGFFLKVKLSRLDSQLQAGDFRLSPAMKIDEILQEMQHGKADVKITTIEGWRNEEIALKLTQELSIPESEFLKSAREGYMFPDTYLISRDASAAAVIKMFEDNFFRHVTSDLQNGIKKQGLTLDEGVILASIVEREGRSDSDRPIIAGIFLKRLKLNIPLQADATLQYVLGYQPLDKTWWKKTLYNEDKKINSPYNTYLQTGLPFGPIANPGLASLKAVAYPNESNYLFYIHDNQGQVHFAATEAEHNANINQYLR